MLLMLLRNPTTALWKKVGPNWKPTGTWIKVDGVWKQAVVWRKENGTWKAM